MIRLFKDSKRGGYMVQTTCLTADDFIADLADAIASLSNNSALDAVDLLGVLSQAMPIAFKLSGYKADAVSEQRTLICGYITPSDSTLVAAVGK